MHGGNQTVTGFPDNLGAMSRTDNDCAREMKNSQPMTGTAVAAESTMDGLGNSILVVDDDESNRTLLELTLEQATYEVYPAADGHDALEQLLTGLVDAVITDWEMPRVDGAKLLAVCHSIWPKIPVIVVSAHAAPEVLPRGAFAWIKKPYRSEELLQVLQAALQASTHRYGARAILPSSEG